MSQVKFLSGLKDQLAAKQGSGELVAGALYFCTDEKKIFRAITNNHCEAVNEEVFFGELPEPSKAFPGKLYLRQSDMTLHVLNGAKDDFKQLSAPADALVPNDISEDLNTEDNKKLASKAAVKAGIKAVADNLTAEITNRGIAETQLLVDAKQYADDKDAALKTDLQKEIDADVEVEKNRAELAEKGLANRLGTIEGEGDGSIKAAVKAEADRAVAKEEELAQAIANEASRAGAAELALGKRIDALAGDGEGSVTEQVGKVQEALDDLKDVVGAPAKDEQPATGLFKEIADEKTAREAKDTELDNAIKDEAARAKGVEEANTKAIAGEASAREAKDNELQAAIDKLNGAADAEGSVAKAVKVAVEAEKSEREQADTALQGAIDNIEEALGLGAGTGTTGSVGNRLTTLETEMDAVEGRATALETAVGAPAVEGDPGTPATGLYGEVDALKAKDASLQAAIDILNGTADEDGSVAKAVADEAKLRKDADDALDGRLDIIEASIGTGGDLEKRVKKNEDDIKVINGEGEGSIKKAVADLVDGAPETLDTLNELAGALRDNADVLSAIETAFDKKLADLQKDVDQNEADCDAAIAAEKTRAEGQEAAIRQEMATEAQRVDKKIADDIATESALRVAEEQRIEQECDAAIAQEVLDRNAAIKVEADRAKAEEADIRADFAAADTELQGAIDEINEALGLGEGATGSVGTRLNKLEAAVGAPAGADPETQPATGLYKEVYDLKAADNALDGKLGDLESVVGDAESGLVKKVDDNAAAIEIINGGEAQEGSIAKALKDAKDYADQAEADAIAAAETKAGELDDALKTAIEKDDGKLMTAIKNEQARAEGIETGLNTRLEVVEASIGNSGNLESRVAAVETKAEANKVAIGDENSGLTKGVADNAAAIAAINNEDNGILAQAKADATAKANAAQVAAEAKAADLDAALETSLKKYADDAQDAAEANAKTYVDEKIGIASVPDGAAASGLHKVIEDGDTAAKDYADAAVTDALTWGSF